MVAAAVVAVTMLGNLRLQASELGAAAGPAGRADDAGDAHRTDMGYRPVAASTRRAGPGDRAAVHVVPKVDADDRTENDDDAHLVPAIYAWDPDVRFVFFRHVSKWM